MRIKAIIGLFGMFVNPAATAANNPLLLAVVVAFDDVEVVVETTSPLSFIGFNSPTPAGIDIPVPVVTSPVPVFVFPVVTVVVPTELIESTFTIDRKST